MTDITDLASDLVLSIAHRLIYFNGQTTTKEIKEEIRIRHPQVWITQNIVSDLMLIFEGMNMFTFTDNGTYRTYYLNIEYYHEQIQNEEDDTPEEISVSKKEALDIINTLQAGDFIRATFTKKDKTKRVLNGQVHTPNKGDGFLLVFDLDLVEENIRNIDLRRLISFSIGQTDYIITKAK
jgi:hypothetical protein